MSWNVHRKEGIPVKTMSSATKQISYDKLWALMTEKKMKKKDLQEKTN